MDATDPRKFRPEQTKPIRIDPAGSITEMPSPREVHHVHIYSDVNRDEMIEFYCWLFNGEITRLNPNGLAFITYDDHDHRVVIIPQDGWGVKPEKPVGISHLAFAYSSLGELLYVYKRMKERGYAPYRTVNHGNSTSFYYHDPDGNTVETMMDNYTPHETQDYKRHYQWSEYFGQMQEGEFDADKMVSLFETGVPDTILIDREKVREMVRSGRL